MATVPQPDPDPLVLATTVMADADQAWKILSLVNEWIRHADAKAGISLASAGVVGGVLFNLVKNVGDSSWFLNVVATMCTVFIFTAGFSAAMALMPRTWLKEKKNDTSSLIFFSHIAQRYKENSLDYALELHALTNDKAEIVRHVADQIHANSIVAQEKYLWADRALKSLVFALIFLSLASIFVAIKNIQG